ncbi:DUF898 family protein [Shimia gijangensis]|uniref:DUF898 family protein n=1 Tax=Shimia gijangensis TaxID=1470563 RepID=UPI001FE708CE|nr:DUF898 family protein [Shimia gijangensis]
MQDIDNPWVRTQTKATDDGPEGLAGEFIGVRGRVFGLALKTGLFTVFTLGLYRFWMKTRLRRWYWSSVRVGGIPAEYVGDPLEKLLGFLIAVVFLAFYIGIVNLILMFLSFSLFQGNVAAYALSFVGVIPLWFYASYRARRYVLARTRWRSIRFGLEPGAWGYAWRALVHWAITIVTCGLLWPRMTFWLEKYRTDRTWYGDVKLEQMGKWTMLFGATKHIILALVIGGASLLLGTNGLFWAFLVTFACSIWFGYGLVYYRVKCWELLTNNKQANGIVFWAQPSPWRVFWIYALGYGITGFIASIFFTPLAMVALVAVGMLEELNLSVDAIEALPAWGLAIAGIMSYFAMFLVWGALRHAFVTMPLWRHYAGSLTVVDPGDIDRVSQRPRDAFDEAEGFAEALDVGAAI